MVKKHSFDKTTKEIGGNLGWITPENYPIPEIGKAVKYIDLNSCSPPINTSFGFHLLWLEKVRPGGKPNLMDHWAKIEAMSLNNKKMIWYENWIKKERDRFFVKILN